MSEECREVKRSRAEESTFKILMRRQRTVEALMRNSNPSISLEFYTHSTDEGQRNAVKIPEEEIFESEKTLTGVTSVSKNQRKEEGGTIN